MGEYLEVGGGPVPPQPRAGAVVYAAAPAELVDVVGTTGSAHR